MRAIFRQGQTVRCEINMYNEQEKRKWRIKNEDDVGKNEKKKKKNSMPETPKYALRGDAGPKPKHGSGKPSSTH